MLQDARKLTNANGIMAIEGVVEFLAYECTYGRGPSEYGGMPREQTIGAKKAPAEGA